jgi:predicted nucleic acid-binding protein
MGLIIADTNIILYIIKGIPEVKPFLDAEFAISEISEIELLGVKDIKEKELEWRKNIINDCFLLYFNQSLKETAIDLKQKYSIKIPDAIIAASAIHFKLPLLTADKRLFKINEAEIIPLIISEH